MTKVVQALTLAAITFAVLLAAAPAAPARPPAPAQNETRASQERPVDSAAPGNVAQPTHPAMDVRLILPPDAPKPNDMVQFLRGLRDNTLFQGIILLLLTAAITGLAVPRIKSGMDLRFFQAQKQHEADLARQASLIADQTKFLHAYAELLWQLHFAMIKLSYAKATNCGDRELSALVAKSREEIWDALRGQRRLISSSINLVLPAYFDRLLAFYNEVRTDASELVGRIEEERRDLAQWGRQDQTKSKEKLAQWTKYHDHLVDDGAAKLDRQVIALAEELGLTADRAKAGANDIQDQESPSLEHR